MTNDIIQRLGQASQGREACNVQTRLFIRGIHVGGPDTKVDAWDGPRGAFEVALMSMSGEKAELGMYPDKSAVTSWETGFIKQFLRALKKNGEEIAKNSPLSWCFDLPQ